MTALEQKLLDELEQLEKARSEEREAFTQSLKGLVEQLREELSFLMNQTQTDSLVSEEKQIELLTTIANQQSRIIELLNKPPTSDSLQEQLQSLGEQLARAYRQSNQSLIEEIKELLEQSEQE